MGQRNRNNMPPDFEPPVPAWAADWPADCRRLTSAFFGIQGDVTPAWREWVGAALAGGAHAPERVERAVFDDKTGMTNHVWIAYWRNDDYDAWWARHDVSAWWADYTRLADGAGYWREVSHVAPDRIETLHSSPHAHGIATLADELEGPVDEHAYPGAARDRIPASGNDALAGQESVGTRLDATATSGGKRVRVTAPKNMCIIRSGQDWSHCSGDEASFYAQEVEPSLREGMDFLRDHPEETRCLCMRLMRCTDADGSPLEQTFGLGYGLDIYAFEEWAKSHPTHLKIFGQFMEHAGRFGEDMQLRLWHEVSVVADEGSEFEYLGCHPQTGLLAWGQG